MGYVFTPPATVGVPVHGGGDLFPVRRIFCVGRNYAAHAERDGPRRPRAAVLLHQAGRRDRVVADGTTRCAYPPPTKNLHHEIELVVAIGTGGADIAVDEALDHVFGYAVGLDMTRRDLQDEAKDTGRPWDIGKGFDQSAPIGADRAGRRASAIRPRAASSSRSTARRARRPTSRS